ncbi:MAG: DUF1700 domain-containing protein [Candidatus Methanomethylophilaceae archaeon]|nr:DUF1700 domain-containing protein [Candidatus Methanomethylophilaceae archaeon]
MNKHEFLAQLRNGLSGLPRKDIEDRLTFYSEMIDDRMEEGYSEEESVEAVGTVDEIVEQIIAETPFTRIAKERIKPKRELEKWEIALIVISFPIWFSLAIVAVAVVLSIYVLLLATFLLLWIVFATLVALSVASVVTGSVVLFSEPLTGVAVYGIALASAGLSIFMFFGCKVATKCILKLSKDLAVWIKNLFIKKEVA